MSFRSSKKHQHQHNHQNIDTSEDHKAGVFMADQGPHRLIDAPPYRDIYWTSHGMEALRSTEAGNKKADSGKIYEEDYVDAEAEEFIKLEHGNYEQPVKDYAKRGGDRIFEEDDIDVEAEEFIALEHNRFAVGKWMSKKKIALF